MRQRLGTLIAGRNGLARECALWIACCAGVSTATAQQVAQDWQAEWGSFATNGPAQHAAYVGGRLTISDCSGTSCKMAIRVAPTAANLYCDATGQLTITGANSAVAHLPSIESEKCALSLERTSTGPNSITTQQKGAECDYFCIPGATFAFTFPLRSRGLFAGADLEACYAGASRSRLAICTNTELASQEKHWTVLTDEVSDLLPEQEAKALRDRTDGPLHDCESAAKPEDCLRDAYTKGIAALEEQKRTWIAAASTPGDPAQADALITKVEGRYRRHFRNGDIQGDSYTSTDSINIRRASRTSIRYSLELEFFNGHSCSRTGVAEFRENGSFVSHTKDLPDGDCYFEITPTPKGFRLADPTGYCRQYDCGARGGYNGDDFTFAERIPAKR